MPTIEINSCRYYYEEHGSGNETILFSHGLLWSGYMFHKQVERFKDKYRVITYDHRGQGKTEVTGSGYDMDSLYEDVVLLIEKLNLGKVHFAGLSMGGFIGMRLAARRPDLVKSLILMETSALPEPNTFKYGLLNTIVKLFGVPVVTSAVMKIMFGDSFLNDPARKEERKEFEDLLKKNKKTIVKAVNGVISRRGHCTCKGGVYSQEHSTIKTYLYKKCRTHFKHRRTGTGK
jgi:pimeloyl-ACP methyl ester carboxylesterase